MAKTTLSKGVAFAISNPAYRQTMKQASERIANISSKVYNNVEVGNRFYRGLNKPGGTVLW